jgi:Xaa-Pro aminopeptidase
MRRAAEITEGAFEVVFAGLRPGMTDKDVARAIDREYARSGAYGYALVQIGALSAVPHGRPNGEALTDGSAVLVDGGCSVDGYWADVTRTRWFGGAPPTEFVAIHRVVHDAQTAALARVRPGVLAEELDAAARELITKAGYGRAFTHRTGHGLGLDGHEPPYLVGGNREPIEEGMTFTIEPGIYLEGRFGVRIEDEVLCGPRGPELLTRRTARMG